jgi:hypothetical protein
MCSEIPFGLIRNQKFSKYYNIINTGAITLLKCCHVIVITMRVRLQMDFIRQQIPLSTNDHNTLYVVSIRT